MGRSVAIQGVGLTTHLGCGLPHHYRQLINGVPHRQLRDLPGLDDLQSNYLTTSLHDHFDDPLKKLQALLDSTLENLLSATPVEKDIRATMPVFLGSSSYGIGVAESLYADALKDSQRCSEAIPLPLDGFSQIGDHLRRVWGFSGADYAYNTACTASANALLTAREGIAAGLYDYALVIGVEAYNLTTAAGFAGMQLLSSSVMRPFDRRRNGLVLGEGCAALLLSRDDDLRYPVQLRGGAMACDTHSISASNPDGTTIATVINEALCSADVTAADVVAIKAHGTASPLNDVAEAAAMRQVFSPIPPFFCFKPGVGHTLGACGAIETALLTTFLYQGQTPASGGFDEPDPALGNVIPQSEPAEAVAGVYMANFFGFGGNNCALVLDFDPTRAGYDK